MSLSEIINWRCVITIFFSNLSLKKEEPKESAWAKIGKAIGEGAKSIATQTAESFAKSAAEELIRNAAK